MPRPLRVFLCHSSNDKPAVRELYQKLSAETWIQPWLDEEELYPGQDWNMEIEKAVEAADAILVCLSKGSITKEGYVQRELRSVLDFADYKPEGTLYIIPVRLEECEPPRRLRTWQYADYFEGQRDRAFQRLLVSLKRRTDALELMDAEDERKQIEESEKREAERVAHEKLEFETAEKDRLEKIEREKAQQKEAADAARITREKLEFETAEKDRLEKVEREKAQQKEAADAARITREKLEFETAEKDRLEKVERKKAQQKEAADVAQIAREKLEIETAEKARLEKARREKEEREAKDKIAKQTKPSPVVNRNVTPALFIIGGVILLFLIWGGIGVNYLIKNSFTNFPIATSSISTETSEPNISMIGEKGETLVYVPAGEFTMGNDYFDAPIHTVYLDAFWIDQTEVTNKQYKICVDAGTCEPPSDTSSDTHPSYYGNPEFDDYPVIYVNWDKANRYCKVWIGTSGSLPTEAQWEKAARGTDAYTYPWGNEAPSSELLNYLVTVGDTTEVGSYPAGASVYGALDMAGNVLEWVNDWYGETYYLRSNSSNNPIGPDTGQTRVLRGGSWQYYNESDARSDFRSGNNPTSSDNDVGFRCARSP